MLTDQIEQNAYSYVQQQGHKAFEIIQKAQNGEISKKDATYSLIKHLKDYTHLGGKAETLANFVQKTIELEDFVIALVDSEIGWSGNSVYQVQQRYTKETLFFLKTFQQDSPRFFPEIYSLAFMQNIHGISSPDVRAIGRCFFEDVPYFLVLETKVSGRSIQQYYNDVGQFPEGSKERQTALNALAEAVYYCGEGLAKLHLHKQGKLQVLPLEYKNDLERVLNKAVIELQNHPQQGIDIDLLKACVVKALQNMESETHLSGVTHGDVKLIHAFYNPAPREFSLLGSHLLSQSLDEQENPRGIIAKDYCKFVLSLTLNRFGYALDSDRNVCKHELLTLDEVEFIKEKFKSGYVKVGGTVPTPTEEDFFLLQHDLFFISNIRRELPEPDLTRLKDLVQISIINLQRRLEKQKD